MGGCLRRCRLAAPDLYHAVSATTSDNVIAEHGVGETNPAMASDEPMTKPDGGEMMSDDGSQTSDASTLGNMGLALEGQRLVKTKATAMEEDSVSEPVGGPQSYAYTSLQRTWLSYTSNYFVPGADATGPPEVRWRLDLARSLPIDAGLLPSLAIGGGGGADARRRFRS